MPRSEPVARASPLADPVRAAQRTSGLALFAIAAGALILGERITLWTVVGFVLVIGGAYLVTRHRRQPEPEAEPQPVAVG